MNCVFRLQTVKHFHEISRRQSIIKEVKTFDDITSDNFSSSLGNITGDLTTLSFR